MRNPPPNYEAIAQQLGRTYATEVVANLDANDENLRDKINTYTQRFGYATEVVEDKIRNDPMFAAFFATNPTRTGFYERVAREWLTRELQINVEQLPQSGRRAIYVNREGMVTSIPRGENKPSKALDFRWSHNEITFYATHKYTKQGGGAQDNQFSDVMNTLRNFMGAAIETRVLIAIVDGDYYTPEKMTQLARHTRQIEPRSYAVHIEDVPAIVRSYG